MKIVLSLLAITTLSIASLRVNAQGEDKSKRPSPPAEAAATLSNGTSVTINYSQPAVKGRTIGKDLEPYTGKIWRTGANEATTFKADKDVKINGRPLPAGTYSFFTIAGDKEWTLIFNKVAEQWGAYKYDEKQDALRVKAKASKAATAAEKLTFTIDKAGAVTLLWGDHKVDFKVD